MAANSAKKGAIFTKLAREIQVAAKLGGPDPAGNSRLARAIDSAREVGCPKDTIERAIKKGSGQVEGGAIDEITYEGFGPHRVGLIVECQTDNRTRTAADIRNLFNKNGGQLGEIGSVSWMFDRISLIEGTHTNAGIDAEGEAIEAGANEVEKNPDGSYSFFGAPEDLKVIDTTLSARGWTISTAELSYKSKQGTELNDAQKKEALEFIQLVDDNDDTHRIHATIKL